MMLLDAERFILHHSEDDINQEGWSILQFARDKLIYCPQGMRTLFESGLPADALPAGVPDSGQKILRT
jgi:hypothetical protein